MSNAEFMVQAINVHRSKGGNEILRGVDLDVLPGQVVCIIGPSGSGKSTFLRTINHLERIDSGTVYVDGKLVGYRKQGSTLVELGESEMASDRAAIGMVFQRFNLFPHMTALQNIIEGPMQVARRSRAEAEADALGLLGQVGLADRANDYPSRLSGGQQQRVAIARALAMRPKLMLFDEPTSSLDPELVGEVLEVILGLARQGMTMLIVTHEIGFAAEVADLIAFMDAGCIVEISSPRAALDGERHPQIRAFLGRGNGKS